MKGLFSDAFWQGGEGTHTAERLVTLEKIASLLMIEICKDDEKKASLMANLHETIAGLRQKGAPDLEIARLMYWKNWLDTFAPPA